MDIKIFQTKNLGFIITAVDSDCGCDELYCIRNPRMLQMFVTPPQTPEEKPQLQFQMPPVVYKEVLTTEDYETTVLKSDYIDVTDKFKDDILRMYSDIEGIELPKCEEDETPSIELFTD